MSNPNHEEPLDAEIELVYDHKTGTWKKHNPYRTVDVETEEDWNHLEAAIKFYCEHRSIVEAVNAGEKLVRLSDVEKFLGIGKVPDTIVPFD